MHHDERDINRTPHFCTNLLWKKQRGKPQLKEIYKIAGVYSCKIQYQEIQRIVEMLFSIKVLKKKKTAT